MEGIWLLFTKRPYVLAFLATYLILSFTRRGPKLTFFHLFWGYLIALASEASSIRNGFPYGWYYYKYENLVGEIMVWGVPIWDSASYVFLSYAGLVMAEIVLLRSTGQKKREKFYQSLNIKKIFGLSLLGAFFTMFLDIIIDPIAHRGGEWFLGSIYDYTHPGWYFSIPISNFLGWFLTAFFILLPVVFLNKKSVVPKKQTQSKWLHFLASDLAHFLFYVSILLFNLIIMLLIQAYLMFFVSLALCLAVFLIAKMLMAKFQ